MSFESFQRMIPFRPGWKREYWDGKARIRPSWTGVRFELDLVERPEKRTRGLRPVRENDQEALVDAFIDSFRYAPEYACYPMRDYRRRARAYVSGYYGESRGLPSPCSAVIVRGSLIVAAALIKERAGKPPLLDCLLVRPGYFRKGLATTVMTRVTNSLLAVGADRLRSGAMLANDASVAWHLKFGFRELPDYFTAQARLFSAVHERDRLTKYGLISPEEGAALDAKIDAYEAEYERIEAMMKTDFKLVCPHPRDH